MATLHMLLCEGKTVKQLSVIPALDDNAVETIGSVSNQTARAKVQRVIASAKAQTLKASKRVQIDILKEERL